MRWEKFLSRLTSSEWIEVDFTPFCDSSGMKSRRTLIRSDGHRMTVETYQDPDATELIEKVTYTQDEAGHLEDPWSTIRRLGPWGSEEVDDEEVKKAILPAPHDNDAYYAKIHRDLSSGRQKIEELKDKVSELEVKLRRIQDLREKDRKKVSKIKDILSDARLQELAKSEKAIDLALEWKGIAEMFRDSLEDPDLFEEACIASEALDAEVLRMSSYVQKVTTCVKEEKDKRKQEEKIDRVKEFTISQKSLTVAAASALGVSTNHKDSSWNTSSEKIAQLLKDVGVDDFTGEYAAAWAASDPEYRKEQWKKSEELSRMIENRKRKISIAV